MAHYRAAYRFPDDQTDLGTLDVGRCGTHTATLQMNHQVRVGSSHSTLDGLPEFG